MSTALICPGAFPKPRLSHVQGKGENRAHLCSNTRGFSLSNGSSVTRSRRCLHPADECLQQENASVSTLGTVLGNLQFQGFHQRFWHRIRAYTLADTILGPLTSDTGVSVLALRVTHGSPVAKNLHELTPKELPFSLHLNFIYSV